MQNRTRNQPEHTQTKSAVSLFYLTVTLSFSNFSSLLLLFFACYRSLRLTDLHNSSSFHLLTSQSHPIPTQPIFLSFPYCLLGSCIVTMELETVFDRADVTINSTLDPLQLQDFYNKMKDVVWVLMFSFKSGEKFGTGFCIHRKCLVVTSAPLFLQDSDCDILARRLEDDDFKFKAKIVKVEPKWDLALLQIVGVSDCRFGKFAKDGSIYGGQNLLSIGHASNFVGSFSIGRAAFQCVNNVQLPTSDRTCLTYQSTAFQKTPRYRVLGDVYNHDLFYKKSNDGPLDFEKNRHPLVPIIQISGFICDDGCSGSPVFNTKGEIIGMLSLNKLKSARFEIALHVSLLKYYLKEDIKDERLKRVHDKKGESSKKSKMRRP